MIFQLDITDQTGLYSIFCVPQIEVAWRRMWAYSLFLHLFILKDVQNLVYRYDTEKADDGVGGQEGSFSLCTLWWVKSARSYSYPWSVYCRCVEALTRAGKYDKVLAARAISMFEDFLLYLNHVGLCTEEISESGEGKDFDRNEIYKLV